MKICINKRSYKVSFLEKLGIKPLKLKTITKMLEDTPVEDISFGLYNFYHDRTHSSSFLLRFVAKTRFEDLQNSLAREAHALIEEQTGNIPDFDFFSDLVYLLAPGGPNCDLRDYQPSIQLATGVHNKNDKSYVNFCKVLFQKIEGLCPLWQSYFEEEAKGDWSQIDMLKACQYIDSSVHRFVWFFRSQEVLTLKHFLSRLEDHQKVLFFQIIIADYCRRDKHVFYVVQEFISYVKPRMARMFIYYAYRVFNSVVGYRNLVDDLIMDSTLSLEDKNDLLEDILKDFTKQPSFQRASLYQLCTDYELDPLWSIGNGPCNISRYDKKSKQQTIYGMYSTMCTTGKLSFRDFYIRTRKYSCFYKYPMAIILNYGLLPKENIVDATLDILQIENQVNEKVKGYNYINDLPLIWGILRYTVLQPDDFADEIPKALRAMADSIEKADSAEWYNAMFLRFLASKKVCSNAELLDENVPDPQQLKRLFMKYLKKHL